MAVNLKFDSPMSRIAGVGEKRRRLFEKLGVTQVGELLYHFPRGYQNRGNIRLIADAPMDEPCAFLLTVSSAPKTVMLKNRMTLTKFTAFDESRRCTIVFFNQRYVEDVFTIGSEFRFWGKMSFKAGKYEMSAPIFEPYSESRPLPDFTPLYPLTEGLTQKIVASAVADAMSRLENIPEILPERIRRNNSIVSRGEAFRLLHSPNNYSDLERGREYFVYEELYIFALSVALMSRDMRSGTGPQMYKEAIRFEEFTSVLPYTLTGAQSRAIDEIFSDMTREDRKPMARLLSGDVGSGKTICAAAAAYAAIRNGMQAALMAPTEILANQHYQDLEALFANFRMTVALLTGSTKAADRRKILLGLAEGSIDLVVGTHSLLSQNVEFESLGLVITDEQHRFGVMQRATLAEKAQDVHTLVMSATPIPRTLALIMYGDLNMSVIDELPPGRQKIGTFAVDESYRDRLNGFIRKQVEEGHQVYVVCPAIESSQSDEDEGEVLSFDRIGDKIKEKQPPLKSASEYSQRLRELFPDINIGFMHGKLKGAEKDKVMNDFVCNRVQILVSTTVIEVGVNVPNATLMIVENAERFGLSQLHQLRGRVGRGSSKSWCILVSDSTEEAAKSRLEAMHETNNGYKIAEKDLALRGPGDFFASKNGEVRQHGAFKFRLAQLCEDMDMLKSAFAEAAITIREDPGLERPENKEAADRVFRMASTDANTLN